MKKRLVLTVMLIGLLAFGAGLGTYAWFTSSATSTENEFKTGTLEITGPGDTIFADLDITDIYPSWESKSKTITVKNSGSLDFKYRMRVEQLKGNKLYDGATPLQVKINDGNFVDINKLGPVELGTISKGLSDTFTIQFKLPKEANNDYQRAEANFTFVFEATQVGNSTWAE